MQLNGWVFVYELSGCGFESSCSHMVSKFLKKDVPPMITISKN